MWCGGRAMFSRVVGLAGWFMASHFVFFFISSYKFSHITHLEQDFFIYIFVAHLLYILLRDHLWNVFKNSFIMLQISLQEGLMKFSFFYFLNTLFLGVEGGAKIYRMPPCRVDYLQDATIPCPVWLVCCRCLHQETMSVTFHAWCVSWPYEYFWRAPIFMAIPLLAVKSWKQPRVMRM